jgi:hypothetical protein
VNFKFYVNEQLKEVLGNSGLVFSQESPNYIQIEKYLNGKPKPGGKSLQNLGGNKLTIVCHF